MAESVVEDGKTETAISFAESYTLGAAGLSLIELPSEILQMVSVDSLIAAESFRFSLQSCASPP